MVRKSKHLKVFENSISPKSKQRIIKYNKSGVCDYAWLITMYIAYILHRGREKSDENRRTRRSISELRELFKVIQRFSFD